MSDLPLFDRSRSLEMVRSYLSRVFKHGADGYLRDLLVFDDGHYRAVFDSFYFTIGEGRSEPSRSQWNTLKKHMRRLDRSVFIFKEYGFLDDGLAYVDFGFFVD
jgi:hypothetical protein